MGEPERGAFPRLVEKAGGGVRVGTGAGARVELGGLLIRRRWDQIGTWIDDCGKVNRPECVGDRWVVTES